MTIRLDDISGVFEDAIDDGQEGHAAAKSPISSIGSCVKPRAEMEELFEEFGEKVADAMQDKVAAMVAKRAFDKRVRQG